MRGVGRRPPRPAGGGGRGARGGIDAGDAQRPVRLAPPDGARPLRDHLRLDVVAADGTLTELTNAIHLVPVSR